MKNSPPCILHIINSLSTGGAELLLKNTIDILPEFRHTVVYLYNQAALATAILPGTELICLEHKGMRSVLTSLWKLKTIIRQRKPLLVHTHLFDATVLARVATPASVPLISTLHSLYSKDAFGKNRMSLIAERLTLKSRHALIGVSDFVLEDYLKNVPFSGKRFVVHNFIPNPCFRYYSHPAPVGSVRLVAVGNLKEAKNYAYLFDMLSHLDNVSLDVYGNGKACEEWKEQIEQKRLNVRFCGGRLVTPELFNQYDFFIQASSHEGFGLSVIEAMAAGIPVLVSDIPVFREITSNLGHFFPLHDPEGAAAVLEQIFDSEYPQRLAKKSFDFVSANYTAERYHEKLMAAYEELCERKWVSDDENSF